VAHLPLAAQGGQGHGGPISRILKFIGSVLFCLSTMLGKFSRFILG
jgi:hypothetical protein